MDLIKLNDFHTDKIITLILMGGFQYGYYVLVRKFSISYFIVIPLGLKIFIALTMGHLDIYRFIVFIKYFISNPFLSPWDFSIKNLNADFPYPPFFLYIFSLIFLPFKAMIMSNGIDPDVLSYALIRIPLLIIDLWLFAVLLAIGLAKNRFGLFLYVFNPILLFHQYYSGQFDLVPAVLCFFAILEIFKNSRLTLRAQLLIFVSLAIKPFFLIYIPILYIYLIRNKRLYLNNNLLSFSGKIIFIVIATKILEFPFILSESYQAEVGVSPKVFWGSPFFVVGYLWLCAHMLISPTLSYLKTHILVTLMLAAFVSHSAGWLFWLVPFQIFLVIQHGFLPHARWWFIWYILFVLRWSMVEHSPVFDSLDVFIQNWTESDLRFGMGYFYSSIEMLIDIDFAKDLARLARDAFRLISVILIIKISRCKNVVHLF